jgi:two-component system, NtrC family, nitrogen regulation sensor histidine kinase NtrY
LHVRIAERRGLTGDLEGFVVTFDDVTDLVSAQRMAAWGDVARRIAHEIKNPLTPIKLSAGQLRRKFAPLVGEERADLERFADVIIRQTDDLGRIVDEFSKFARMPAPQRRVEDVLELVRNAIDLQKSANPDVKYFLQAPEGRVDVFLDTTMISQALTNLLKNALEAIESRREKEPALEFTGEIRVIVDLSPTQVNIRIQDNGIGLPQQRARLFEPYVTTRAKGTGLGLSIVKKIAEEHGAQLELLDAPIFENNGHFGAEVAFTLPLHISTEPAKPVLTAKSGEQAA